MFRIIGPIPCVEEESARDRRFLELLLLSERKKQREVSLLPTQASTPYST